MFVKTTKEDRHTHVAYISDETGMGYTSDYKGHVHPIEGGLILEADGHIHDVAKTLEPTPPALREDKTQVVKDVLSLYQEACAYEGDSFDTADVCEDFYSGDGQWREDGTDHKDKLEKNERAALTLNQIASKVDLLSGYQRQNRQDVSILPTGSEDAAVAEMLTKLIKNILTRNDFEHNETQVFDDQVIAGRGNFDVYISYDEDIEGEIKVERFPWRNVKYGPHDKWDLSDCSYLVKHRMYTKADAKNLWPDKAKDIQASYDAITAYMTMKEHDASPRTAYQKDDMVSMVSIVGSGGELVDIARKEILVLELWRKEPIRTTILVTEDDEYTSTEGWNKSDISAAKTIMGVRAVERKTHRIRVTEIAGTALLSDEYPDLSVDDFHTVPTYATRRDGKFYGKVKHAIDAQREFNKRNSQIVDILGRVSPWGWYYDDNTFVDERDMTDWLNNVSTPGFTAKIENVERPPVQQEGIKFPAELARFAEMNDVNISRIMNINNDMLGMQTNARSELAIAYRQRQGFMGNEFLFDNLAIAKRRLVKIIIAMIQKYYTPERIYRILSSTNAVSPFTLPDGMGGEIPFEQANAQAVITLLTENDLTKYDVIVSESAYNPSTRNHNLMMWLDAASKGIPVPPMLLVELSDLPDKEKAKKMMAAHMQSQQQQSELPYQTEIQKTIINNQNEAGQLPR